MSGEEVDEASTSQSDTRRVRVRKSTRGPWGVEDEHTTVTMDAETAREWDERYWRDRP